MEVLSIIPARAGSKGIPRKNIKEFCGLPLIAHSIIASKESKYITRTILSTEDKEIKDIALKFGCEVIDRPKDLAQDETKTISVMLQVVDFLEKKQKYIPQVIILLQPTCPLRTSQNIDEAFELYKRSKCDSVFSVTYSGLTHAKWRQNHDGSLMSLYDYRNRPRRQDSQCHFKMYTETGSIYIIEREKMLSIRDFIGNNPVLYIEKKENCIDIDTIEDFHKAESIILKRK